MTCVEGLYENVHSDQVGWPLLYLLSNYVVFEILFAALKDGFMYEVKPQNCFTGSV